MDDIDFALDQAANALRSSVPNPLLWSGPTATACAEAIERLALEIAGLRVRVQSGWSPDGFGWPWVN